jgi:hypothetical protein
MQFNSLIKKLILWSKFPLKLQPSKKNWQFLLSNLDRKLLVRGRIIQEDSIHYGKQFVTQVTLEADDRFLTDKVGGNVEFENGENQTAKVTMLTYGIEFFSRDDTDLLKFNVTDSLFQNDKKIKGKVIWSAWLTFPQVSSFDENQHRFHVDSIQIM